MIELRNWFFQVTSNIIGKGSRFRDGDRPNQQSFFTLFTSVLFKAESGDRAKEDDGTVNGELNGHVVLATDAQVLANEDQATNRSLVVQPHQTTTVESPEDTIGDYTGNIVESELGPETTRKNYVFSIAEGFKTWLIEKLIPAGGTTGQTLAKTSDTDYDVSWQTVTSSGGAFVPLTEKGQPNGVATLDATGVVPASQLPVNPEEVLSFPTQADFPTNGDVDILYIDLSGPEQFIWDGIQYVTFSSGSVPPSVLADRIVRDANNIQRDATTTDQLSYTITSPIGQEFTTFPKLLLVKFDQTNVGPVLLTIDGLATKSIFYNNADLGSGDVQDGYHQLLTFSQDQYHVLNVIDNSLNVGSGNIPNTPKITIPGVVNGVPDTLTDFTFTTDKSGLDSGDSNLFIMPYNGKISKIEFSVNEYTSTGSGGNNATLEVAVQAFTIDGANNITDQGSREALANQGTGLSPSPDEFTLVQAPINNQNQQVFVDIPLSQGDLVGIRFETNSGPSNRVFQIKDLEINVIIEVV